MGRPATRACDVKASRYAGLAHFPNTAHKKQPPRLPRQSGAARRWGSVERDNYRQRLSVPQSPLRLMCLDGFGAAPPKRRDSRRGHFTVSPVSDPSNGPSRPERQPRPLTPYGCSPTIRAGRQAGPWSYQAQSAARIYGGGRRARGRAPFCGRGGSRKADYCRLPTRAISEADNEQALIARSQGKTT